MPAIKPNPYNIPCRVKMIEFINVQKNISNRELFTNLNLVIDQEITIIKGESGIGKSTLFDMVVEADREYKGEIFVGGKEVSQLNNKERQAFLKENIALVP